MKTPNWKDSLLKDKRATFANAVTALERCPVWKKILGFDEFAMDAAAIKPTPWGFQGKWTDEQDDWLLDWMQRQGVYIQTPELARRAVLHVARKHPYHPLRDYLDSCAKKWDGSPRLKDFLWKYLGAGDAPSSLLEKLGSYFLIQAVRRIYYPGSQADYVLMIMGKQGVGKSSSCQALFDPYFTANLGDITHRHTYMQLNAVWGVELCELDGISRREANEVRAFVTRREDQYVMPYGRSVETVKRHCVFIGTTNETEFLNDYTGNRRWWPFTVINRCDPDAIAKDRDQLWGEAAHRKEERCWPDTEQDPDFHTKLATEHEKYRVIDAWENTVLHFMETRPNGATTAEILTQSSIGKPMGLVTKADTMRVAAILRSNEFTDRREIMDGRRHRVWASTLPFCTLCKGNHKGECRTNPPNLQ